MKTLPSMYYLSFGCCFFSLQCRARRFSIDVQTFHLPWRRGCIFLHYLHWFNMIFVTWHYVIDLCLMQVRPAWPESTSSTTSMLGETGARSLSLNFCRFYNNSNFRNFVSVMLCRWGLWNTATVVGPALQLSFIAIELHQSRHSHHILRVADFRVMLAKHEVWHLYVE